MTQTLLQFRDSLRYILSDKTIWRDTMLNEWINAALNDYSNYFPMEQYYKIDCTVGNHEYTLSYPVIAIVSVEYPDGQVPPRYLVQLSEHHPNFWDHPCYDLRQPQSYVVSQGDPQLSNVLVIGESPTATEDIILRYLTPHRQPAADASYLTVPEEHLEALRLFVYWKALVHIAMDQDIDAGRKSNMITALGGTAKDAEYAYHYKLKSFGGPAPHTGYTGPWPMDNKDRIY
jgi:hypothetical protein